MFSECLSADVVSQKLSKNYGVDYVATSVRFGCWHSWVSPSNCSLYFGIWKGENAFPFGVDFSFCWSNIEVCWYSLEQNIGFVGRQAFHPLLWTSSGLKGSWKLSTYIRFGSLRSVKVLKLMVIRA